MNETINYVELPARDFKATQDFFSAAFGWSFIAYGEDYLAISGAGLDGGFYRSDLSSRTNDGAALVVLYSKDLEATLDNIRQLGAKILRDVFDFPGGRRFHFADPSGNEWAVWSDQ